VHSSRKAAIRASPVRDLVSLSNWLLTPISLRIEREILASANLVTTTSRAVAQDVQEFNVNAGQIRVLGNGVDHELFIPGKPVASQPPYLLYVGRLHRQKGLLDLVECARIVCKHRPDVRFVLAGKGPLEGELQKRITSLQLGAHFDFAGHIAVQSRHKLIKLYQNATMLVHPAYYEGLPTTVLEAMACAKPVVATGVSGILDVITSGVDGLLVPVKCPDAMAEVVLELLNNRHTMAALGAAARQTIEERYAWEVVSDHFVECYREAIDLAKDEP
jgi:glycosyltransferase involved in cell wall biosynthesis